MCIYNLYCFSSVGNNRYPPSETHFGHHFAVGLIIIFVHQLVLVTGMGYF